MITKTIRRLGGFIAVLLGVSGAMRAGEPLQVVATTAMVADLVRKVGGPDVAIDVLMGPGVDPHLYKPTTTDVRKLQRADVVFYNGLFLEGKMGELFERLQRSGRRIHAVTEALPKERLIASDEYADHPDPHVWFDVELWAQCVAVVEKRLGEASPERKAKFALNAAQLRDELAKLHAWSLAKAGELPEEKRVLVTSHDAYNYFGRAYGFQVIGLQGISTTSEAGLADVIKLVDLIKQRGLKAIFVETSVSHATIERVAKDSGAKIGGELFSDAMGQPGQMENGYDLGTYEGMIKHNLTTIVEALK